MIPFGNHPLYLMLLGWMLPPKPAFMKFTTTPVGEGLYSEELTIPQSGHFSLLVRAMTFTKQVFQDIVLPMNRSDLYDFVSCQGQTCIIANIASPSVIGQSLTMKHNFLLNI